MRRTVCIGAALWMHFLVVGPPMPAGDMDGMGDDCTLGSLAKKASGKHKMAKKEASTEHKKAKKEASTEHKKEASTEHKKAEAPKNAKADAKPESRDRYRGPFPPCREPPGWEGHKLATTTIGKREGDPLFPGKLELWWKNDPAYAHLCMGVGPRMMGPT